MLFALKRSSSSHLVWKRQLFLGIFYQMQKENYEKINYNISYKQGKNLWNILHSNLARTHCKLFGKEN